VCRGVRDRLVACMRPVMIAAESQSGTRASQNETKEAGWLCSRKHGFTPWSALPSFVLRSEVSAVISFVLRMDAARAEKHWPLGPIHSIPEATSLSSQPPPPLPPPRPLRSHQARRRPLLRHARRSLRTHFCTGPAVFRRPDFQLFNSSLRCRSMPSRVLQHNL
jgi:hypothetical protein